MLKKPVGVSCTDEEWEAMTDDERQKLADGCSKQTKKDSVQRFDSLPSQRWMGTKFELTEEGFLKGRAVVTNIGVFQYRDSQGNTWNELRLPEEVFSPMSLESLKLKPVTNDHPGVAVDPGNAKELQVGSLGSNPSSTTQERSYDGWTPQEKLTDGLHLAIDMVITDKGAISDVLSGKTALSCGYTCDREKAEAGATYLGMPYDYIQRNIRYNHVAIVDKGRAGDAAKIRLDSADSAVSDFTSNSKEVTMLKKVIIDSVEREAEEAVIADRKQHMDRAAAAESLVATLTKDKSTLEAERDTMKSRVDSLEKELAEAKAQKMDQAAFDAAVSAKLALLDAAKSHGVEVKADMADADIRKALIGKAFPTLSLDGKDETYIQVSYDNAMIVLGQAQQNQDAADTAARIVGTANPTVTNSDSVETARQKMIARMNGSKE